MRELAVGLCVRPTDGALLVEQGHDRLTGERFFRAIGGGCEPGEPAVAAVVREWREEFALAISVIRVLGALDNRFIYEGRPGHEHVTVFEVAVHDLSVYAADRLEGYDPAGQRHAAAWVAPAAFRPGAPPLYPAGVLELMHAAG